MTIVPAAGPVDLVALTAELIEVPSPSLDEGALCDLVQQRLLRSSTPLTIDRIGHNLVARTDLGRPLRLVLAGHLDTVPANGNERARLDGDVLWGLGASDMKGGLAVMLAVALGVSDPAVDVTYIFYEAEETDARFNGLGRLEREAPELLAGDAALLGEPTGGAVEAGCQGTMRMRVTLRGARAHTARPWMGRNAVHRFAPALARLAGYEARTPVIDGCTYREAAQVVGIAGGIQNTAGEWQPVGNVVPDVAVLTVNHRFAPDRSPAEAEAYLRGLVAAEADEGAGDRVEVIDMAPAAAPGLGHPLLRTLIERNRLEVRAKLGWTDVARFAARGIPAANFGPGDATLAHTADERVTRQSLEAAYAAVRDLVERGPAG